MKKNDYKIADFLIVIKFPDDTDFTEDVDTEFEVRKKLCKTLNTLVLKNKISRFTIGDDDVILEKLTE